MKKIFFIALLAGAAMGSITSCSNAYEDATSAHNYGETENPPLKGSDATNMSSYSLKMKQAEAGTETKTVSLEQYADEVKEQLGMTLDEAIAGISNGTVKFLPVNPARRVWDKTASKAGDNKWNLTASGVVTNVDSLAAITMEFLPASKELKFTLTKNATTGIIPVTAGFVKTDNSSYSVNYRFQNLVTVVDASVCDVEVTIPTGGYASAPFYFKDIAQNIEYAFGVTDLKEFAKGLDTSSPVYDVYMMDSSGTLSGGEGKYTANGAGYWLTEDLAITSWGTNHALFLEPFIYDDDAQDYYSDGGGFNCGRLSNDTPASGTVLYPTLVIKPVKDTSKSLTINFTLKFQ